jgi:sec-independent protein translocase protein TatC
MPLLKRGEEMATQHQHMQQDDKHDMATMSIIEHLEELRWRLFKALGAIVAATVMAFIFREQIVEFLAWPFPEQTNALTQAGRPLVVTGLTEGLTVFLKISLAVGFIIALPVVLYQTWAFIAPGLMRQEKKYAIPFILAGMLLFVGGISLGYLVIRYPVEWLVTFAGESFAELITANSYFSFVITFLLTFGLIFEIPLVLTFLVQVGVVTPDSLKRKRSVAHFGMWVTATFLMPGADIWSPVILGAAMSGLYELTFVFVRLLTK